MDFTQGMPLPGSGPSPMTGSTGPATVAPQSTGTQMAGQAMAVTAMKLLTKALGVVGPETPEGKAVIQMLAAGNKAFGVVSEDIMRAESKLISETVPPVGPSPESAGAIRSDLAGKGVGAPASPPPAMAGAA